MNRPPLERYDKVGIKEPKDMGRGTVLSFQNGKYWIELEKEYLSHPLKKIITIVRRTRNEIFKLP